MLIFCFIHQGTSVLSPGLPIGIIIIPAIMIYKKSATNVFEKHPCLYTLMFGCVFAKVSQKLVVRNYVMIYCIIIYLVLKLRAGNYFIQWVFCVYVWCYHHKMQVSICPPSKIVNELMLYLGKQTLYCIVSSFICLAIIISYNFLTSRNLNTVNSNHEFKKFQIQYFHIKYEIK